MSHPFTGGKSPAVLYQIATQQQQQQPQSSQQNHRKKRAAPRVMQPLEKKKRCIDLDVGRLAPRPVVKFIQERHCAKACGRCKGCRQPVCGKCKACLHNDRNKSREKKQEDQEGKAVCAEAPAAAPQEDEVPPADVEMSSPKKGQGCKKKGKPEKRRCEALRCDVNGHIDVPTLPPVPSGQKAIPTTAEGIQAELDGIAAALSSQPMPTGAAYDALIERKKLMHSSMLVLRSMRARRKSRFSAGFPEVWSIVSDFERRRVKVSKAIIDAEPGDESPSISQKRAIRDELDETIARFCSRFGEVIAPVDVTEASEFWNTVQKPRDCDAQMTAPLPPASTPPAEVSEYEDDSDDGDSDGEHSRYGN